jgi:peptide/nickel transport system substrate-binding protein
VKWHRSILLPLTLVTGLLAASLGGLIGGPSAAAAGKAPSNITLTLGVQTQDNWWFPDWTAAYCGDEGQIFGMAYRPLLFIGNNDTINYTQSVASGITVSHHDTVYTIHIGNRFKWSNGQPVTAYDAQYDAEIMLAAAQPKAPWTDCGVGIGGLPTDWKSVTAPNPHTLVLTTTKPVNPLWFEENGIAQLYPVPKAVWDHSANWTTELRWIAKVGVNSAAPQFKVIDGPYAYGKFVNDSYETIVANPHYTGPRPARIKTITFLYETSEQNLWASALRKNLSEVAIPSQYESQRAMLTRNAGYRITPAQYSLAFDYIVPNLNAQDPQASLLRQLYIRQALELAINQQAMIRLADNIAFPVHGPIPPIPRTVYYHPAVTRAGYPFNPARGKRLLEAHGWHLKNGVMTNKAGKTLTFTLTYLPNVQWVTNVVQLWQRDLKAEGIVLNLVPNVQVGAVAFTTHKWELAWWGGGWGYVPDYYPSGDGLFSVGGTANPGDYSSPRMTQLINATLAPGTPKQEIQRMFAYELYAAKDLPVLFMPDEGGFDAVQPWLHLPPGAWASVMGIYQYNYWYTTPR